LELIGFLKGTLVGFAMAVPIGPIGVICIRKTLTEGRISGLIVGFGAATADLFYGCIAAFGLTLVSNIIFDELIWIRIVGGTLFVLIGIKAFFKHSVNTSNSSSTGGFLRSYISTIFLSLTNPLTILGFITFFAALGVDKGQGYLSTSALALGVCFGSSVWFLFLSYSAAFFGKNLEFNGLKWVNRISGVLLVTSGIVAIVSLL
jgi:threonine/homoserine/homoserine lactone efflux protein